MRQILLLSFLLISATGIVAQNDVTPIAEIQGTEYISPKVGKKVTTKGVVTGIRRSGFYIQTPDAEADANPMTSEGVYVFTKDNVPRKLNVGDMVTVKGTVTEYRPNSQKHALYLTEIVEPSFEIISSDNPLPAPITLTKEQLNPAGKVDQLERFEGMRVFVEKLTVSQPTGGREDEKTGRVFSDGVFWGVPAGLPRPFREPGVDALTFLFDKLPRETPVFDMNPENLRVDSDGLNGGKPIDVTADATVKNIYGVIDYQSGAYTLMMDFSVTPVIEGLKQPIPASPAKEDEVTVSSFNLENFFDDEKNSKLDGKETRLSSSQFEKRLKKASMAIRKMVSLPDVLGIVEIENKEVLDKLAARVNSEAEAENGSNPGYVAYLEESNDLRGIDVGFLVKSSKIKVNRTEQLAKKLKLKHKDANPDETLFSRPPFLGEFEATRKDGTPFKFTVIVNHFKSYRGIDDPRDGDRVRNKKRLQAEFVAKTVVDRQTANPEERIVLVGDFNAFQFNDGYNDLIGILKGKPTRNVLVPSTEIFETGLVDLVDYISADNRYSYVYAGSAQVLDHVLVNKAMVKYMKKFGFARFNADFPLAYADDENRVERVSDHDVPVAFLNIEVDAKPAEAPAQ
ncbi:MAG: hypothetical protein R2684_14015 [Pyrinomonadaceae bacterium]